MNEQTQAEYVSGTVAVEGAKLRYVVEGEGTPCLVIGSSRYYPRTFSQELRKQLRLIFIDARHFCASDPSFDPSCITLDTYAADVEKVRVRLGLGKVAVMGHSIHGLLALEYARRYPRHTSHVIVIASPPCGVSRLLPAVEAFWQADASEARKDLWQRKMARLAPEVLGHMPSGEAFLKQYVESSPKYWYDPEYDCSWLWEGVIPNMPITTRLFGELFLHYDLAQRPGPIAAPVFLGLGRYDYVVPYTLWDQERDKLPHLSFNLFEHSGHTPQLEEPAHFDRKLQEWLL